jgi:outer membrane protein OmpA-like peptidoglycan-associated protein
MNAVFLQRPDSKAGKAKYVLASCLLSAASLVVAAPAPGERISFVSCPVVRDTPSVPCWLSDYEGTTYYLTIQSDVSALVQPPMLGHQVLVEGVVSNKPLICGGVVLDDVRLSVMPERDANCNTMLPADARYTIDFNPRPPGPSGGRLAFDAAPADSTAPPPQSQAQSTVPQTVELHFDFDKAVSFRHPAALVGILELAGQIGAKRMQITGVRGAHRLSNGILLQENADIGQRRAEEVAGLLQGAGLALDTSITWSEGTAEADGNADWQSRRVTILLEP